MPKLLEEAIDRLRELPEEEQDAAADALFAYISSDDRHYTLRPDQAADVRRIRNGLRSRTTRLATKSEVDAVRNKAPA